MKIEATRKTAFFIAAWTSIGLSSLLAWEKAHPLNIQTHKMVFLTSTVIFLFIPVTLFVIGPQYFRSGFKGIAVQDYWLTFPAVTSRITNPSRPRPTNIRVEHGQNVFAFMDHMPLPDSRQLQSYAYRL